MSDGVQTLPAGSTVPDPWPAPRVRSPVDLTVRLPGSKSLTNRAVVLAALADAPSIIHRPLLSRDTTLMCAALSRLGVAIDDEGADWRVTPHPLTGNVAVDCGLAGTVTRFVPAVAALSSGRVSFDGDPHMRQRPISELLRGLRALGVSVEGDALPFTIAGHGAVPGGRVVIDASSSSQFISALLLAGARYDEGVDLIHHGKPVPSLPHVEMTMTMLRQHGVDVDTSDVNRWRVAPGPIHAVNHTVEPDLSNAAPFVALAALSGGQVTVREWPAVTTQAGDALRDILSQMGCQITVTEPGLAVQGPDQLAGIDIDLHDVGELTPALAALCALADGPSHLRGIAHIRSHETDRISALATQLATLGADVTEQADGLSLRPAALHGGIWRTYDDHRMAHAGVILGAAVDGVGVENIATTSKTFPDFPATWAALVQPE